MERPEKLYRGIHLDSNLFYYFNLEPDEITVHYEPVIDSNGRKTVTDGNEYGVYMSESKTMTFDVYGKPHRTNIEIEPGFMLSYGTRIELPMVGVVYEIDTKGLDIKEPWMTEQLHGLANNGFPGREWITDSIPKSNYKIIRMMIGADFLHNDQIIEIDGPIEQVQQRINQILMDRYNALKKFVEHLKTLPPLSLRRISENTIEGKIYKYFFSIGGILYTDDFDITTKDGLIKYLMKQNYISNNNKINMRELEFIYSMFLNNKNIDDTDIISALNSYLDAEINAKEEKKQSLINEKGPDFNPTFFDSQLEYLYNLKNTINNLNINKQL